MKTAVKNSGISKTDIVFIIFGSLDALTFLLNLPRIFRVASSSFFSGMPTLLCLSSGLWLVLNLSYATSAYGFIKRKSWAFILYYCQFPIRLFFCSGSLVFLSRINVLLGSPAPYYIFGLAIIIGEIARVVITIILRKRSRKQILP